MRMKRDRRIAWCTLVASLYALVASLSVTCIQATKSPTVTTTDFPNIPAKVSYFDDSSVVLWHDAKDSTVYRSDDEGKTWAPVKGPASRGARFLIEHPYDTKQAFILSDSNEHWRTRDRGATWQRFLTPNPPADRAGSPLDFHADPKYRDYILFTGRRCSDWSPWRGSVCHDIVYYTTDAFATDAKPAMEVVLHCTWAKTTRELEIPSSAIQRIFCIAWDESSQGNTPSGNQGTSKTRLYESDDFFKTKRLVELGIGRDARGFMGLGASRRYLITAIQAPSGAREMSLYVSMNGVHWQKAQFPHGQVLHENAYTIIEGPRFHLLVDVLDATTNVGSLFMSDPSGTNFTLSTTGTVRNSQGVVDYEHLANIDGVAIANVRKEIYTPARIQSVLTYDEGSHWTHLQAPSKDVDGRPIGCDVYDTHRCALHLHGLIQPHNAGRVFSSSAPGIVMGVGNVGDSPRPYAECDTFLSEDAGKSWRMVARHPHKYEFGDQGGLLVMIEDKESVHEVKYSFDYGRTWNTFALGSKITPYALTTIPDSTALKFLVIGAKPRETSHLQRKQVAMFLDFAPIQKRKCTARDFEKWYATSPNEACILGHKQWYMRRRADADCFVLEKFHDPQGHEDACECTQFDYECDFNFVPSNSRCEPAKSIPIPAGACHRKSDKFLSPSGYRKVPGNSCIVPNGQRALDAPVMRSCSEASVTPELGAIHHQQFQFPALVADVLHFERSPHVVVRLEDGQVYQSSDDGSTWHELKLYVTRFAEEKALALIPHAHDRQRAFILSGSQAVFYTTDGGLHWEWFTAPLLPNTLGLPVLDFHLTHPEWLLWTGSRDCQATQRTGKCHTEVFYSQDNGVHWKRFDTYVRKCAWLLNKQFQAADSRAILCESYREKQGEQATQHTGERVLQLVLGNDLYRKKQVLFPNVLGFSVFEQYLLVAEVVGAASSLTMQVSMDAARFAAIQLPPQLELAHHAFTVLDSVTQAVFMHVSTQLALRREWGDLVKSNSNGTYYTLSLPNVNRDAFGYVDFEKMQGIDGIALVNVVGNPQDAALTGQKQLQTRISHNDGGHWTDLTPPAVDALGNAYECNQVGCNLHLHNVLERPDVKMITSDRAATGFMVGIGNVGRSLTKYTDCDTFLTRDAGFTWEEVHKDAHKWAYGDHGAILLLVDDERPTDEVLYSLDQGATWKSYKLEQRIRIITIDAVPEDTKRRFVLFGHTDQVQPVALAIFLDMNAVMPRECVFDSDAAKSDFERWSPSEQREETCLFGARRWYWRRKRDRICYVGDKVPEQPMELEKCSCSDTDYECEFNHFRDPETHQCVAYPGMKPLTADIDAQCAPDAPDYDGYWYERTNMRRIPISMCQGGARFDRGTQHRCPHTPVRHGVLWWISVLIVAGGLGFALAYWYTRGDLQQLGAVRLLEENATIQDLREQLGLLQNLATGFLSLAWARIMEVLDRFPMLRHFFPRSQPDRPFSSYYMLSTDEDAEILHDYDSDELPPP